MEIIDRVKTTSFFLLMITFGLSLNLALAQTRADSLTQELEKAESDSVRIELWLDLAQEYEFTDPEKAKGLAQKAMTLAEKTNQLWAKGKCATVMGFMGTITGDYTAALKHDNLHLQAMITANDSLGIAKALNNIGNDYNELGEYDEAYYHLTRSFRVARSIKDSLLLAVTLQNIGHVFKELGQYDIAINHFNASLKISEKVSDPDGPAYVKDELGSVYLHKKEYSEAEKALNSSLSITRHLNIKILEPQVMSKFGQLYMERDDYEKSLRYYDTAYQLYHQMKNNFGIAKTNLGRAKVKFRELKLDEALDLTNQALELAKTLNARILEISCYTQLSELEEQRGDFKKSLAYFKSFTALRDSLFGQEMTEKLYQYQVRFEIESKDSEIAALSEARLLQDDAIKRQQFIRNILVVVVALTGVLLITVYRSGQRRVRINKLLIEHQDEIKQRSIELEQLNQVKDKFFSIISHDLRSPINALSGILNLMDRNQITQEEFTKLAKELRVQFNHTKTLINNLLDWALLQMDKLKIQPEKIDLSQMVDENFKLLSSLHLKELKMTNLVPQGLSAMADLNTINLVFRNLILNALKFTDVGGEITVAGKAEGNLITISVSDNGVGIAPEVQAILFEKTSGYSTRGTANEKGTGLGLILCKEFVERNGGKIWLQSELGKGSTFNFTLNKA